MNTLQIMIQDTLIRNCEGGNIFTSTNTSTIYEMDEYGYLTEEISVFGPTDMKVFLTDHGYYTQDIDGSYVVTIESQEYVCKTQQECNDILHSYRKD